MTQSPVPVAPPPRARRSRVLRTGALAAALALSGAVALSVGVPPAAARDAAGGVTVIHDVQYKVGPCGGETVARKLDAYLPQGAANPTAAVVFVHGGGFVGGDKQGGRIVDIATDLARRGWAVFSINYCMPQDSPGFPVEVDDTVAAVRYVAARASFHVDPARIATWGGSAGANLALMAAVKLGTDDATAPVAAAVGWSGPYNFLDLRGASPGMVDTLQRYIGCDPRQPSCHDTAAAASPITYVDGATTPPVFMANSTREMIPLFQMTSMAAALRAAGVPHTAMAVPGSAHSMSLTDIVYCPSVDFLKTYLGPVTGGPCKPPAD